MSYHQINNRSEPENPFDDLLVDDVELNDLTTSVLHKRDSIENDTPESSSYGQGNLITFDTAKYSNTTAKLYGPRLLYFTSVFVSLGVFVFGYDQGVCSGIITFRSFEESFNDPTPTQIGLVVSILEIGALISSLFAGSFADKYGRKKTICLGAAIFCIGGTGQTLSWNLYVLGAGRLVSGFGVGLLSTIVPIYQSEISPSHARGRLACLEFTGNVMGYSASVWVDYSCYFFRGKIGWVVPLFLQTVMGLLLFGGSFFIVESPRWLLDTDQDEKGYEILNLLYLEKDSHRRIEDSTAVREFNVIKKSILEERVLAPYHERTYKFMFKNYKHRLAIACSALMFAQMNGINVISYYAPMVFEEAGFKNEKALLVTGINSLVYLASTVPPWFLVDSWGRKPIFISGGLVMGVCLLLVSLVMWLNKPYTPICVALLVIVYNAFFGYSWGPVAWMIGPELLPLVVRAQGVSLSSATNWLFNYIVGQLTPILQDEIEWKMYLIPSLSCFVSCVVVWKMYPETKGVELEDMDKLFGENDDNYERLQETRIHDVEEFEL